jgi:hypothetical protein
MKRKLITELATVLLITACVGSAEADIIDSTYGVGAGSFELGNFINGGGNPNAAGLGYMGLLPGDRTITGWTVGGPGNGVDWLTTPTFGSDTGIHSVDLNHTLPSSISTVIPTTQGQIYDLSFGATALFNNGGSLGIVSAGNLSQAFTAPYSASLAGQTFPPFSFLFTATDTSTTITFLSTTQSLTGYTYGPVIDSVSVNSVPIPAAGWLFGSAFAGFAGLGRRGKSCLAK